MKHFVCGGDDTLFYVIVFNVIVFNTIMLIYCICEIVFALCAKGSNYVSHIIIFLYKMAPFIYLLFSFTNSFIHSLIA